VFNQKTVLLFKKGWCVMSKSISIDQSHTIIAAIAALATNVDWTRLNGDMLQEQIIKNPTEAGKHFNRFLQNGARMSIVGEFKIVPAPFDPGFVGKNWKIIAEKKDKRSSGLREVDFAKAKFSHCLKKGESSIKGEEFLCRLKKRGDIRLGATAFMGLWNDYIAEKGNSVIERLYQEGKIKDWLYFFGTILLDSNGDRGVLSLSRFGGGRWYWHVIWLEYDCDAKHLAALLQV
jgi:hypothetical protein